MYKKLVMFLTLIVMVFSMFSNVMLVDAKTKTNDISEIPKDFIPIYQSASKKFNIHWLYIASIHNQETTFSSNVAVSYAGATGHTQFMPCTWVGWTYAGCPGTNGANSKITSDVMKNINTIKEFGGYGFDGNGDGYADKMDLVDAIYSTANYMASQLRLKTSVTDERKKYEAITKVYNHDDAYVKEVVDRFFSYKDQWKDSPEGTTSSTGIMQEGFLLKGIKTDNTAVIQGDMDKAVSELGLTNTGSSGGSSGSGESSSKQPKFFKGQNEYKSNVGIVDGVKSIPGEVTYKFISTSHWFYKTSVVISIGLLAFLITYASIVVLVYVAVVRGVADASWFEKLMRTEGGVHESKTVKSMVNRLLVVIILVAFILTGWFVQIMGLIYHYVGVFLDYLI